MARRTGRMFPVNPLGKARQSDEVMSIVVGVGLFLLAAGCAPRAKDDTPAKTEGNAPAPPKNSASDLAELRRRASSDDAESAEEALFHGIARNSCHPECPAQQASYRGSPIPRQTQSVGDRGCLRIRSEGRSQRRNSESRVVGCAPRRKPTQHAQRHW